MTTVMLGLRREWVAVRWCDTCQQHMPTDLCESLGHLPPCSCDTPERCPGCKFCVVCSSCVCDREA